MEARAIYLTTLIDLAVVSDRDVIIHEDPFLWTCHNIPSESAKEQQRRIRRMMERTLFQEQSIPKMKSGHFLSKLDASTHRTIHRRWILHRHARPVRFSPLCPSNSRKEKHTNKSSLNHRAIGRSIVSQRARVGLSRISCFAAACSISALMITKSSSLKRLTYYTLLNYLRQNSSTKTTHGDDRFENQRRRETSSPETLTMIFEIANVQIIDRRNCFRQQTRIGRFSGGFPRGNTYLTSRRIVDYSTLSQFSHLLSSHSSSYPRAAHVIRKFHWRSGRTRLIRVASTRCAISRF